MKEIITEQVFRERIARSAVGGYLLFGDEDYLKLHALKYAKEIAAPDPSLSIFNDITVDCSTSGYSHEALYSALAAAPMMAESKVVTLSGLCVNEMKAEELDRFCEELEMLDEFDFNLLIVTVSAGMLDEGYLPRTPSTALKKLGERLTPVRFGRVQDAKLCSWVIRHFNHHGLQVHKGVPAALLEYCGKNMYTLANEIEKLSFYALSKGRSEVALEDIDTVSSPSDEIESFSLGAAVIDGSNDKAMRILGIMKSKHIDPLVILGELSRAIADMLTVKRMTDAGNSVNDMIAVLKPISEFRVRMYQSKVRELPIEKLEGALRLCSEADLAQKQSMSGYIAIEKLVCSL